jgi:hypothetical protein
MDHLQDEIRIALRRLRRQPGFTLTAILTLALGLGANIAIFSLMHAALLRSLPVDRPDQRSTGSVTPTTAGNLSHLPPHVIDLIRRALREETSCRRTTSKSCARWPTGIVTRC